MDTQLNLQQLAILSNFFKAAESVDEPYRVIPKTPLVSSQVEQIGQFRIPVLGELVQGEIFLWTELIMGEYGPAKLFEYGEKVGTVTLLMKFRHNPNWSIADTLALPTKSVFAKLYELFEREKGIPQGAPEGEQAPNDAQQTGSESTGT